MADLKNWEQQQFNWLKEYLYPDDQSEEQAADRTDILVYLGTGRLGDLVPDGINPPEGAEDERVTEWTMGRDVGRLFFKTNKEDDWAELDLAEDESGRKKGQNYQGRYYMRTGHATRIWLAHAALYIEEIQAGRQNDDQDSRREELLGYVGDARDNMPSLKVQREEGGGFDEDQALDVTEETRGQFMEISKRLQDGATRTELYIRDPNVFERLARREESDTEPLPPASASPERDGLFPFLSGAPVLEGLGAIRDARSGWPTDSEGNPIYVFDKKRPFYIRGQFNVIVPRDERAVQAAEAELAQKILQDFGHRTARLHLACAAWCSAPGLTSGEYVRVSRSDIQDLLGVDRGTRPDLTRAERDAICYREVENLKSVGVQITVLSNARTENGRPVADYDRLRKLQSIWDLNIHEHGQAAIDFDGKATVRGEDWQLLVRPTAWAELYVHSDAARQFGYFSRALLEEIDWHRKPAAGDLAIALLRYNKNQQGQPRDLTVKRMLEICQLDGAADRNTQYQHRNKLEAAILEQERWGWKIEWNRWPESYRPNQANRRMPNGYWEKWQDWKVTFHPPRDLATATRRVRTLKSKPAPKKSKGSWGERVDAILEQTGWSQAGLAEEIGVSKMSVSKWSRNESTPGAENQKAIRDLEQWLA